MGSGALRNWKNRPGREGMKDTGVCGTPKGRLCSGYGQKGSEQDQCSPYSLAFNKHLSGRELNCKADKENQPQDGQKAKAAKSRARMQCQDRLLVGGHLSGGPKEERG